MTLRELIERTGRDPDAVLDLEVGDTTTADTAFVGGCFNSGPNRIGAPTEIEIRIPAYPQDVAPRT